MPLQDPIYDPHKSYEENWKEGPFGEFKNEKSYQLEGEPKHDFLGNKVYLPFGVPAGPLLNANFISAAFKKGFDLPTYKTVRTQFKASHDHPNVLPVKVFGDLTLEKAAQGLITENDFYAPLAITNSFGVGSYEPDTWQPDMKKAVESAGKGQLMIASCQGTAGGGPEKLIEDYALAVRLTKETGAKVIEINLSCPNEGRSKLLCEDIEMVERIAFACKETIGNIPLLLKLAYFEDDDFLNKFLGRITKIVDGLVSINTIPSNVRTLSGKQALPGEGRLRTGICGAPVKWAGLEMSKKISKWRAENNADFSIIGCGGLINPSDHEKYIENGADATMSATGMMWNGWLAKEIKEYLKGK